MMSKLSRSEILELIPLYILEALPDDEREQVQALLATDPEAQALLAQYQQVRDVILLSAVQRQPSPALKASLLERIQHDQPYHAPHHNVPHQTRTKVVSVHRGGSRRWQIAVALLVMVLGAVLLSSLFTKETSTRDLYQALAADTGSQKIALVPFLQADIQGDLVIAPDGRQAVIRVENLPTLEANQAFQLWLVDDTGSVSGGIYRFQEPGVQYIALPLARPVFDYLRFGVSLEPAEGSPFGNRPSGPRVFNVTLQPPDEGAASQETQHPPTPS